MADLERLPYVVNIAAPSVVPGQLEIKWITDGEDLYGNNVESMPEFGSLNRAIDNVQKNVETCDRNIGLINDGIAEMTQLVAEFHDLEEHDHLQKTIPPKLIRDVAKYRIVTEGTVIQGDLLEAENFDAIIWEKDGDWIDIGTITNTDIGALLVDELITVEDEGIYQALIYNRAGAVSSSFLHVAIIRSIYVGLPSVEQDLSTDTMIVKELDNVFFQCYARNYESLQWYKNGFAIEGTPIVNYVGDTITPDYIEIDAATASDSGTYKCVFTNPNGSTETSSFRLNVSKNVISLPIIGAQPVNRTGNEGGNSQMITTGQQFEFVRWEKDGVQIENQTSGLLSFTDLTTDDEGWYRAKYTNDLGSVYTQYAYLTVIPFEELYKPIVVREPTPIIHVNPGDDVFISAEGGYHTGNFWQKDGEIIYDNIDFISITGAVEADAGNYVCIFYNKNGFAQTITCTVIIDS